MFDILFDIKICKVVKNQSMQPYHLLIFTILNN